jgi:hypothetical protein
MNTLPVARCTATVPGRPMLVPLGASASADKNLCPVAARAVVTPANTMQAANATIGHLGIARAHTRLSIRAGRVHAPVCKFLTRFHLLALAHASVPHLRAWDQQAPRPHRCFQKRSLAHNNLESDRGTIVTL